MENKFKVKLRSQQSNLVVAFDVVPDVSEQRSVEYKSYNPVHSPGTIYSYSHTPSRIIAINNARLISRTPEEAARNMARLNILRSWCMPYFGRSHASELGLPPDVLSLYAFARGPGSRATNDTSDVNKNPLGNDTLASNRDVGRDGTPTHLQNIPVVINNLQITYPSDVDYIETGEYQIQDKNQFDSSIIHVKAGQPFPTIMAVDIQLWETHSPTAFNQFCLRDFRAGTLDRF